MRESRLPYRSFEISQIEFFLDDGILIVEKESGQVVHFEILFALLHLISLAELVTVADEEGSLKLFRVYANELLAPDDMETLAAIAGQEENVLVLVTCENESADGGYLNRRAVFVKPVF